MTRFEQETLVALWYCFRTGQQRANGTMIDVSIHMTGQYLFKDPEWGGRTKRTQHVLYVVPKINMTMGRLASKGLVQRIAREFNKDQPSAKGDWVLTTQGREVAPVLAQGLGVV